MDESITLHTGCGDVRGLRRQGAVYPGGETVTVPCPWEGLPVWFVKE